MGWKLGKESSEQPEIFLARTASLCDALTEKMNTERLNNFRKKLASSF